MKKNLKSKILVLLAMLVILIIFGVIIYLNQYYGFFMFSKPYFNKTYVSLRFDDGLISQKAAFEILRENNLTGSMYIITDKPSSNILWEKEYYLNWSDIQNLSSFMEVGSHSKTHADLTKTPAYKKEIIESKQDLLKHGINATTFVYPGGNYNHDVVVAVEENYDCASTQDIGTNWIPIRPHLLKDFTFRDGNSNETFSRVIKEGKWNILTFHDIGEFDTKRMPYVFSKVAEGNSITPEFFESLVKYLKENNIEVITIADGCKKFK